MNQGMICVVSGTNCRSCNASYLCHAGFNYTLEENNHLASLVILGFQFASTCYCCMAHSRMWFILCALCIH